MNPLSNDIHGELDQIKHIASDLTTRLRIVEREINDLFLQIKMCNTIQEAEQYFQLLDKIQFVLAFVVHEYDLGVPDRLWRFTKDFDNFQETKMMYFTKIKNGEYKF